MIKQYLVNFWWLLIPAVVYLSPFLLYPAFNIIDDGASLYLAEQIISADSLSVITDVLIEEQVGRFRPIYHLTFTGIYALAGFRPFFFWLAQAGYLGLTLIGMAVFLYQVTRRYWLSALLPLTLLFSPTVSQNYFRLGTAEPKQMLFWIWMLIIISTVIKKGWGLGAFLSAFGLFVLALLTKETSVIFGGIIGLTAIWQLLRHQKSHWVSWGLVGLLGVAIGIFYLILPKAGSYSSGFQIELSDMWQRLLAARLEHAVIFFPLVGFILGDGMYHLVYWRQSKVVTKSSLFWSILLLSQLILILMIGILPWQHQLPRYYYPVYLISLIYIGVTIPNILKLVTVFDKWKISTQVVLIAGLAVGATLLQLRAFQSGVGLNLDPALMYQRLLQFRIESAFAIFLILAGVAATMVRLSLKYIASAKKPSLAMTDFLWPSLGVGIMGGMIFLSAALWQHQWPRNRFSLVTLAVVYGFLEARAWLKLNTQPWAGSVRLGPRLAFALLAAIVLLAINGRLLLGRGLDATKLVTGVWQDLQLSFDTHQISYALLKDLFTSTPTGTRLYVVGDDYELIFEIGLYASQFNGRRIQVITSNQQLITDVGGQYPYLELNPDPIQAFKSADHPKQLILRKQTFDALIATGAAGLTSQGLAPESLQFQNINEKTPRQVFGVIPSGANWVVAE